MAAPAKDPSAKRIIPAIPLALGGSKPKPKPARSQKSVSKSEADIPPAPAPATTPETKVPGDSQVVGQPPAAAVANGILTPTSNVSDSQNEKFVPGSETPESKEAAASAPVANGASKDALHAPDTEFGPTVDTTPPAAFIKPAVRELPPPFYPAQPHSVSSATSTSNRPESAVPQATMHQTRSSSNSLVFGGYRESNSSSPAIPLPSGGPPNLPPQGPHASNFVPPPPFIPAGHAYHYSEPHASQPYPSPMGPQPHGYGYPKENPNYMAPPHFAPPRQYYAPNGRFRQPAPRHDEYAYSARYVPQVMPYYPQNVRFVDHHANRPPHMDPRRMYDSEGTPTDQQKRTNDISRRQSVSSSTEDVTSYLQQQFSNSDFADYVLELSHREHFFSPVSLPVHGVLLARSPKLRSLMAMPHGNTPSYPRQLEIMVSDKFMIREDAFVTALKRLYGEALLDFDSAPRAVMDSMRLALAYAAAGHFLQVDEIITRGLDLATKLLSWESVELALAFALDGGLSFSWNSNETGDDKGSSSSFDDAKIESPASAPTYGIYSERLLNSTVQFLVTNIPTAFKFVPSAPASGKARFSQIRFGDMTADDQSGAPPISPIMGVISGILAALPFPVLKHVLENPAMNDRLGGPAVADITRALVDERENRRRAAAKARPGGPAALEDRLLHNARWVEKVEPAEHSPSGVVLTRHRSTADTPPPSSDSTKS